MTFFFYLKRMPLDIYHVSDFAKKKKLRLEFNFVKETHFNFPG